MTSQCENLLLETPKSFTNVSNEPVDCYAVWAEDKVPDFDVLVTNPPFSGDHIEKLMAFCAKKKKPSFLLMVCEGEIGTRTGDM